MAFGDMNTTFFYRSAKPRKTRNKIILLKDKNGDWIADQKQIKHTIIEHFQDLFQAKERNMRNG